MPIPTRLTTPFQPAPGEVLATLRANWTNLPAAIRADGSKPPFPITTPAQTPIAHVTLPAAVQQSLAAHPGANWVKLLHAQNGQIVSVVDDGSPLPPDEHIIHLQVSIMSSTLSVTNADTYLVIGMA